MTGSLCIIKYKMQNMAI